MKVFKAIFDYLLGTKYYANIVVNIGTNKNEICSYIFTTKEQARKHKEELDKLTTFKFVTTISFRSKDI